MPKSIVVVDDDESLVFMLKENFEAEGYEVRTGYDGPAVARLVEERQPDLVLMDFNMPGWNGLQALEKLRANPAMAKLPVIFLTGEASERLLPGGGNGYTLCFSKPIELDRLNTIIQGLLT